MIAGTARIGVQVCHCGANIAGADDIDGLARYAGSLPGVAIAREYEYMCSDPAS